MSGINVDICMLFIALIKKKENKKRLKIAKISKKNLQNNNSFYISIEHITKY
jgi:hypothetical protein